MKPLSWLALCLATFFYADFAMGQSLFLQATGGYNLGMATLDVDENVTGSILTDDQQIDVVRFSFGKGWQFGGLIGWQFNRSFGVGVEISYLRGSAFTSTTDITFRKIQRKAQGRMLRLIPECRFRLHLQKMDIYTHLGFVLGLETSITKEEIFEQGTTTSYTENVYSEGLAYGARVGVSIQHPLTDRIYLTGGLQSYILSFGPEKRETTASSLNGQDRLESLSTSARHTILHKNYVRDLAVIDSNQPSNALTYYEPFSSIGFQLGIVYYLKMQ